MQDEYLDLVDENDVVIGKMKRSEIYSKNLSNFRVINLFIVNSKGELWIPRRGPDKSIYPLCLDMSMGGHVESGETYEDALRREAAEELNIDIDKVQCEFFGKLTPSKDNVSAFMKVYKIKTDFSPEYNKKDIVESTWISKGELLKRINNGEKVKSDLPKLVKIFRDKI